LLQGWEVSGIVSFQSGNPLTITIPRSGRNWRRGQRPNVLGR
jgi:hypothetical protein